MTLLLVFKTSNIGRSASYYEIGTHDYFIIMVSFGGFRETIGVKSEIDVVFQSFQRSIERIVYTSSIILTNVFYLSHVSQKPRQTSFSLNTFRHHCTDHNTQSHYTHHSAFFFAVLLPAALTLDTIWSMLALSSTSGRGAARAGRGGARAKASARASSDSRCKQSRTRSPARGTTRREVCRSSCSEVFTWGGRFVQLVEQAFKLRFFVTCAVSGNWKFILREFPINRLSPLMTDGNDAVVLQRVRSTDQCHRK